MTDAKESRRDLTISLAWAASHPEKADSAMSRFHEETPAGWSISYEFGRIGFLTVVARRADALLGDAA